MGISSVWRGSIFQIYSLIVDWFEACVQYIYFFFGYFSKNVTLVWMGVRLWGEGCHLGLFLGYWVVSLVEESWYSLVVSNEHTGKETNFGNSSLCPISILPQRWFIIFGGYYNFSPGNVLWLKILNPCIFFCICISGSDYYLKQFSFIFY